MSERKKSFCAGAPACYHAAVPSPFPSPHSVSLLHSDPLSSLCLAQGPPPTIPTPRTSCNRGAPAKPWSRMFSPRNIGPTLWEHEPQPSFGGTKTPQGQDMRSPQSAPEPALGPSRVPWSRAGSLGAEQGPLGRCSHQGQRAVGCGCSSFSRAAHKCSTQGTAMALALGEDWSTERDHLQPAGTGPRRAEPAPSGARGLRAQVLGTGSGALELTGCPAPVQQPLQPGTLQGGSWAPREPLTAHPGCAPSTAYDQSPAQLILHTERPPAP